MALMCIPYEYFKRVYVEVFMSQFDKICKGYIFPYEILREYLLAWKVYYRILFLFLLSHMFPWMDKFLITENIFSLVL